MFYKIYSGYIVPFGCTIPIIFAIRNFKFLLPAHKIIFYFLVFTLIGNTINTILARNYIPNLFMFHIYVGFEFAFISVYFSKILKGRISKISPWLIPIFAGICIVNFLFIQNGQQCTYTRALESVIIIGYCMMFFNRQSQTESGSKWTSNSDNWITVGLLIFYSCSLFTFMFSNYFLHAAKSVTRIVWGTYGTFIIIENILFAIAFHKCRTRQITS